MARVFPEGSTIAVPESLSPEQRSLRARLAAHKKWATTDPVEGTEAARTAFLGRFEDEVDPDRVLPDAERQRRAESARKAYFTELAYKSSRARAGQAAGGGDGDVAA